MGKVIFQARACLWGDGDAPLGETTLVLSGEDKSCLSNPYSVHLPCNSKPFYLTVCWDKTKVAVKNGGFPSWDRSYHGKSYKVLTYGPNEITVRHDG